MVTVMQDAYLIAIPFLAVDLVGFAAYRVRHSGSGHEISLVGRIDEHATLEQRTVESPYGLDATVLLGHSRRSVEPVIAMNLEFVVFHVRFKNVFCHMRFKDPHGSLLTVDGCCTLTFVAVFVFPLPFPSVRILVARPNAMIEIA